MWFCFIFTEGPHFLMFPVLRAGYPELTTIREAAPWHLHHLGREHSDVSRARADVLHPLRVNRSKE